MPSLLDVRQPLVGALKPNPAAIVWKLYLNLQGNIPFVMQHQLMPNWCWAAASVSVALFYKPDSDWTQCKMAKAQFKNCTCSENADSEDAFDACNSTWKLEVALRRTKNMVEPLVSDPIGFADVMTEIDNERALCAKIKWYESGGHYVGIKGYQELGATEWLTICDSLYGDSNQSLPNFENSYQGHGEWDQTFLTQAPPDSETSRKV